MRSRALTAGRRPPLPRSGRHARVPPPPAAPASAWQRVGARQPAEVGTVAGPDAREKKVGSSCACAPAARLAASNAVARIDDRMGSSADCGRLTAGRVSNGPRAWHCRPPCSSRPAAMQPAITSGPVARPKTQQQGGDPVLVLQSRQLVRYKFGELADCRRPAKGRSPRPRSRCRRRGGLGMAAAPRCCGPARLRQCLVRA